MSGKTGENVKVLSKEKFRVLAEVYGWSLEYARGYVDGEAFRVRGGKPTGYLLIGLDEHCIGFRAGYYERHSEAKGASQSGESAEIPS
jgi:hypothetical protein